MKRYKKIVVLLLVLAVCSIAAFAALNYEEKQEQIRNSEEVILQIAPDTAQSLSWEYEDDNGDTVSLAFHKTDGVWYYDEDEAFPVDETVVNDLLAVFEEFGVSFVIEEVEDYSQYGLEDPVGTIRLSASDQDYEILLGDFSTMDQERYVSIGDGSVYLVQDDPMNYYNVTLDDMLKDDDTPALDQVSSIQFEGTENYSIQYEENSANTYCSDDVYFAQLDGESLPLDTGNVKNYLANISTMDLQDYVTYNATEQELDISELQSAIEALEADSFTDEQPAEREEISFTVYLNNENYPQVQVQLYRYDGTYCLAVVDGEPVSLVERSYVVDLIEAVNAIVLN